MKPKDREELLKLLKDPEVLEILQEQTTDKKLEALLAEISVGDDDTIESVSKQYQAKLTGMVEYFNEKLAEVKASAVEEATQPTRDKEAQVIRDFSENNPGMKNAKVVAMMQPLYDEGMPLEEAYKRACKGLDLDPATGELPEGDGKGKEAKGKEEKKPKTSMRSALSDDADEEDESGEEKKPVSLDEALAASHNDFVAKHGDPFAQ